jgi:anaphase-promoting complex subunit 8
MLISDPRRLDFLDHYSNVLYTLGSRQRLAFVAHLASAANRYRPETCCVIGNYYSLTSRHADAVNCFRRALNLDRNFSSAWTLLGHEYFKLHNTHAAIECYRHAVDINNKDYRAVIGLGQVYEVLEKPTFSLHYYRRAVALRPSDVDLWQMMATCLTGMSRVPQAIDAWKKALSCSTYRTGNYPGDALDMKRKRIELFFQLANTYEESQNRAEARVYV